MEEVQFYYSAGGREVYGPVNKIMMHQLLRDNIIDSNYFFCRAGETEWRPLDPIVLEAEPATIEIEEPPAPAPETEQPATSYSNERLDSLWSSWVEIMESTSVRIFLRAICVLVPLLIGFILTSHYALTLPKTEHTEDHMGPLVGRFIEIIGAVALVVYLIGLPFPTAYRLWIRTTTMLFLGALVGSSLIH